VHNNSAERIEPMQQLHTVIKNEAGTVMVVALLILVVLTAIGITALTTSSVDTKITGNEKFHKIAFYAAEGARTFVEVNTDLWGSANTTVGAGITFPDNDGIDNNSDGAVDEAGEEYVLAAGQSFNGSVNYLVEGTASGAPLRGTGDSAGTTKVQRYEMDISGNGPNNAACRLDVGFYRRSPGA
jgi:hypothetical protein